MKLTISRSKNSASFYVQKTIRKPDGTISSVTVEKLGNLEQVRAKAGGRILMYGRVNTLMNLTEENTNSKRR